MKTKIAILSICLMGAVIWAQTTQPVTVNTSPVVRVSPLPQIIVVQQPQSIKTIDITTWQGYHDGGSVRIALDKIHAVRPHVAGTGTLQVSGSAVDVSFGVWYTTESTTTLLSRLAAKGWGE